MSATRRSINQASQYLAPVIRERKANMKELGEDWSDKPVCLVVDTFVIAGAHGAYRTTYSNGSLTKLPAKTIQISLLSSASCSSTLRRSTPPLLYVFFPLHYFNPVLIF